MQRLGNEESESSKNLIKFYDIKIFGTLLQNLVVIARQQQRVLQLQQH